MKELSLNRLNVLEEEYRNNKIASITRRALNKNKISDLVRVNERSSILQNDFSINIKTMEVTDQKKSGRCWIFAGLNVLREEIASNYNVEKFELSQNYVAFYDKLEKCNYFLENIVNLLDRKVDDRLFSFILARGIEDGGQWDMFANIVRKYGVVPKSAYEETYQSENTNEIDDILNRYLRKTTSKMREFYNKDNKELINALKDKTMDNIYKLLCSSFGVPPKKFSFEFTDKDGNYHIFKDLTPIEFLNDFVGINIDDYVSIINSPTKDKPYMKMYTIKYLGNLVEGKDIKHLNLGINRIKQLVISQLKDNKPVWFGSDCMKYGDRDEGIWDDLSYDYNDLLQIELDMTKEEMLDMGESAMNHAMVITGVNIDEDKPTKWKIENSWGDEKAKKGYHVATDSWFDKYVFQVVVNKKYLNEEELKVLESEPVELDPWDPMGTLAD